MFSFKYNDSPLPNKKSLAVLGRIIKSVVIVFIAPVASPVNSEVYTTSKNSRDHCILSIMGVMSMLLNIIEDISAITRVPIFKFVISGIDIKKYIKNIENEIKPILALKAAAIKNKTTGMIKYNFLCVINKEYPAKIPIIYPYVKLKFSDIPYAL